MTPYFVASAVGSQATPRSLTLRPEDVRPEGADAVRAAGVSHQALEDAVHVCALFNMIDRIADALAFRVPPPQDAERAAPRFFERGYR